MESYGPEIEDYEPEIEGYWDYGGETVEGSKETTSRTTEDVWQAAADYCVMFFNNDVIYDTKLLDSMVNLVEVLLKFS